MHIPIYTYIILFTLIYIYIYIGSITLKDLLYLYLIICFEIDCGRWKQARPMLEKTITKADEMIPKMLLSDSGNKNKNKNYNRFKNELFLFYIDLYLLKVKLLNYIGATEASLSLLYDKIIPKLDEELEFQSKYFIERCFFLFHFFL